MADWYNILKSVNDSYGSARSLQSSGSDSLSKLGGIMSLVSRIASLF